MSEQIFDDPEKQALYEQKEKWKARALRMRSALEHIKSDEVAFHPIIRRYEKKAKEALEDVNNIEELDIEIHHLRCVKERAEALIDQVPFHPFDGEAFLPPGQGSVNDLKDALDKYKQAVAKTQQNHD